MGLSIAKNYFYSVIYQVISILLPIITIPYVSRVLGSEGVGINAFTNSIVQYFVVFGGLSFSIYGNRAIAYVRNDAQSLDKTFWSIFYLKTATAFLSIIAYLVLVIFIIDKYALFYILQSLYLLAVVLDISWLFMGLEQFKKLAVRNTLVRLVGAACIFIFVKEPTDLWKYIFILSFAHLAGQVSMWFYLPRIITYRKIRWTDIQAHLLPAIHLFLPQLIIQVYLVLSKTLLGIYSTPNEVGYFDSAEKVVKLILSLLTALGLVMMPRISNLHASGDDRQVKEYIRNSFEFLTYMSIPIMFGLMGISNEFVPLFFGQEFEKSSLLMSILCPIIVFISWSNVLGNQYLLPTGKTKQYTYSVASGAFLNLILNLLLINMFESIGVALSMLVSELTVTVVQFYFVRKDFKISNFFDQIWKYLISGLVMLIGLRFIGNMLGSAIITIILQIIVGSIVYVLLLLLLRSKVTYDYWNIIKRKVENYLK